MTESDKKYYENKAYHEAKHKAALSKAANRGRVSQEWHDAGNILSPSTLPEFKKIMKQADKEWEKENQINKL